MSLKKNIVNLLFANAASFIVPLLQFPYITRVLGVEEFGLFVFSFSLITFLFIITNYGFSLYLPKLIIENKSTKDEINDIFMQTILARLFLFGINLVIIYLVYLFTDYYKNREELVFIIALAVFFNSFMLQWFYQTKEVLYIYSRTVVIMKIISLLLVFVFVKTKNDLDILLAIMALTNFIIIVITHYIAVKKFDVSFAKTNLTKVKNLIINGFEYFISRVGVSIYATLGGVVIGAFSGSLKEVAYFGAAHQLYTAGVRVLEAISVPLLPYMTRTKNYKLFFKIVIATLVVTLGGALVGWFWGDKILAIVYGAELVSAKSALDIFMITIFLSIMGMLFGYPALVPLGKARIANMSVIYAGIAQVFMIAFMYLFDLPFTAVSIAITYFFCDLIMMSLRCFVFAKEYRKTK